MHDLRDVGGTPGGLGMFSVGIGLSGLGLYLLFDRITVSSAFFGFAGSSGSSFGLMLIPVMIGIGFLFYNGKSAIGWILFVAGLGGIVAGVIANMHIYFRSSSLLETLIMLGLVAGGLGLVVRATRGVERRVKAEGSGP